MACDDEVFPLQERIATIDDDANLTDVYITERQLLYAADDAQVALRIYSAWRQSEKWADTN